MIFFKLLALRSSVLYLHSVGFILESDLFFIVIPPLAFFLHHQWQGKLCFTRSNPKTLATEWCSAEVKINPAEEEYCHLSTFWAGGDTASRGQSLGWCHLL